MQDISQKWKKRPKNKKALQELEGANID